MILSYADDYFRALSRLHSGSVNYFAISSPPAYFGILIYSLHVTRAHFAYSVRLRYRARHYFHSISPDGAFKRSAPGNSISRAKPELRKLPSAFTFSRHIDYGFRRRFGWCLPPQIAFSLYFYRRELPVASRGYYYTRPPRRISYANIEVIALWVHLFSIWHVYCLAFLAAHVPAILNSIPLCLFDDIFQAYDIRPMFIILLNI